MHNNKIIKLFNQAVLEKKNKNFLAAKKKFLKVIDKTKSLIAINHLIEILLTEKHFSLAKAYLEKLIKQKYNLADNLNNYGIVLSSEKDYKKSIIYFKKAIDIDPHRLLYQKNLAYNYRENKQYNDALIIYKKIYNDFPNDIENILNLSNLFFLSLKNFSGFKYLLKAHKLEKNNKNIILLILKFLPYIQIKPRTHIRFLKIINNLNKAINTNNSKTFDKKYSPIKMGFFSACFYHHPIGFFLLDFFKEIKKYDCKIFIISDRKSEDFYTKEIKKNCDKYIATHRLNDQDLINQIKNYDLDFLFDLDGITHISRRLIFKHKLAKKTVSWCGWLASTGFDNIDYIMGDKYGTPSSEQFKYTEKLINNHSLWASFSTSDIKNTSQILKLDNKYFIFAIFQNALKFSRASIFAWSKILNCSKNTKILFANESINNSANQNKLLDIFKDLNVSSDRIVFSNPLNRNEVLQAYNSVDAVLDTFPYNGGTSSFEASYMGVPIITLDDSTHVMFKCGVSINSNLGLKEFIGNNVNDYINKAINLAETKNYKLRKQLLNNNRETILFDMKEFCKNFFFTFNNLS